MSYQYYNYQQPQYPPPNYNYGYNSGSNFSISWLWTSTPGKIISVIAILYILYYYGCDIPIINILCPFITLAKTFISGLSGVGGLLGSAGGLLGM